MRITLEEKVEVIQEALKHWKRNGLKNLTVQEMINFNAWAEERERELTLKSIDIAFTHNHFDQWRASKVGAYITFKKGVPVIRFKDRTQYNEFLALNSPRKAQ
jgi:hypothetical protein